MRWSLFPAVALLAASCVVEPTRGDFTFFWSFAGEESCARARVYEVDITLTDAANNIELTETTLCEGDGRLYEDILEGNYTLFLDAYDRRGNLLLRAERSFFLEAGALNDLGEINLTRAGEQALGDLAFFWTFDGEPDCGAAGVREIDVQVVVPDTEQQLLADTANCSSDGLFLLDIDPGPVEVWLDAFNAQNERLYTATVPTSVIAGETRDLGTIDLAPYVP